MVEAIAAEKIREKRRLERKQFKIDRAAAMLDAAKAAEAVITTGQVPVLPSTTEVVGDDDIEVEENVNEEEVVASSPATTVGTEGTVIDVNTLTPQTFLVRPTRPDANRNRGRNAFKRKPKPKPTTEQAGAATAAGGASANAPVSMVEGAAGSVSASTSEPATSSAAVQKADEEDEEEAEDELDENLVEEMEHLQLSLEEAWFLSTGLGVLRIYDAGSVSVPYILHWLDPS